MPKTKKEQATELLSQMIEASEILDRNTSVHPVDGVSWMTHHLKLLDELLKDMDEK